MHAARHLQRRRVRPEAADRRFPHPFGRCVEHQIAIDVHYAYLVGYGDTGGWPTWNANGDYPLFFTQTAAQHGATPMFTYLSLPFVWIVNGTVSRTAVAGLSVPNTPYSYATL